MSTETTAELASPFVPPGGRRRARRRALLAATVVVCVAAGVVGATDPFRSPRSSHTAVSLASTGATQTVTRRSLSQQTEVDATLGYAGTYNVVNLLAGSSSATAGTTADTGSASDNSSGSNASLDDDLTSLAPGGAGGGTPSTSTTSTSTTSTTVPPSTTTTTVPSTTTTTSPPPSTTTTTVPSTTTTTVPSTTTTTTSPPTTTPTTRPPTPTPPTTTKPHRRSSPSQGSSPATQTGHQAARSSGGAGGSRTGGRLGYQAATTGTTTSQSLAASGSATSGAQNGAGSGAENGAGSGQPSGIVTALPAPGQVVAQGQSLYSVNGNPIPLLYGSVPDYRSLSEGKTGTDVKQLNADLVALGYATASELDPTSDTYSAATTAAVEKLQAHFGEDQTGSLSLGQVVFLPSSARVTSLSASVGSPISSGSPVLQATSTTRQVQVPLDATQQSDVAVGDKVTITLPNNQTTPGVVSSVGTVATCPSGSDSSSSSSDSTSSGSDSCSSSSDSSGSSTPPTITVDVAPSDPKATGTWDQAPVQVTITTSSVASALVVPVAALLAQAGGGYAVEVVGADGAHHLVPVRLGLFDDADGLVQVSGSGLAAGQKVVVPST